MKQYKQGDKYWLYDGVEIQFLGNKRTKLIFTLLDTSILVKGNFSVLNKYEPKSIVMVLSLFLCDGIDKVNVKNLTLIIESFESYVNKSKNFSTEKKAYYQELGKELMEANEVIKHGQF
jgi:hypothetical protein